MEQLGYLFLGWLLGVLAPAISRGIERKYRKKEIATGLLAEMVELRIRLAATLYKITFRFGTIDRAFIQTLLPVYTGYTGTYPVQETREALERLSSEQDADIAAAIAIMRTTRPVTALNLKHFRLPYFEANIGNLDLFPESVKFVVLEILAQLDHLNEEVDNTQYFTRLTFDSSLTPENHRLASGNVTASCLGACTNAQLLIEKINRLKSELED